MCPSASYGLGHSAVKEECRGGGCVRRPPTPAHRLLSVLQPTAEDCSLLPTPALQMVPLTP